MPYVQNLLTLNISYHRVSDGTAHPTLETSKPPCSLCSWIITTPLVIIINIIIIIVESDKNLNSMKQNNIHSDTTSILSFTTFCPFAMTHKTHNGHDRRKYLISLTRSFRCDRPKFQSYQQILINLEHLRKAFNVKLIKPLAQSLSCLQIHNFSHSLQTQKETAFQ